MSKEDEGIYALVEKYVDLNNQIKEFKKNNDEKFKHF